MVTAEITKFHLSAFAATGLPHCTGRAAVCAEQKRENGEKLLQAAQKLFSERGYDQTKIHDICKMAGVGEGTFYRQFNDKLDCFAAFAADAANKLTDFISQDSSSSTTFEQDVRNVLCRAFDYSDKNPGVMRAVLSDIKLLSPEKRVVFDVFYLHILKLAEKWKRCGESSSRIDTRLLSHLIIGIIRQADIYIAQNLQSARKEIIESIICFVTRGAVSDPAPVHDDDIRKISLTDISRRPVRTHADVTDGPERKPVNRRKILNAAKQLFADHGYNGIGPKDIAGLAGIGVATFYANFEDKLDCFLAATTEAAEELYCNSAQQVVTATTFPETVYLFLYPALDCSRLNPGLYRAMSADIKILSNARSAAGWRTDLVRDHIEQWKNEGWIAPHFDSTLLSFLIGGVLRHGTAYIFDHPHSYEEAVQSVLLFIIKALGRDNTH